MTETEARLAAVRAEREALRIQLEHEREAHKATADAAMADHSRLDAERARLAKENEGLKYDLSYSGAANATLARDHAFMREERRQAMESCSTRSKETAALRAQLSALQAEHEEGARAAEEKIGRLIEALKAIAGGPHWGSRDTCQPYCPSCLARAALAEVQR